MNAFDQLEELKKESEHLDRMCIYAKQHSASVARIRNSSIPLTKFIRDACGSAGDMDAIKQVINEMSADICRIAELRLNAKAREYQVSAAQKRAVVAASILPLPDMGEKESAL